MAESDLASAGFVQGRRFAAAIFAVAVQFLLIDLLIHSLRQPASHDVTAHEITMVLPRLLPVVPKSSPTSKPTPRRATVTPQPIVTPLVKTPVSPESLHSLHVALFECTPENWGKLSPEDRAHCNRPGEGVAIQAAPNLMGTRSHAKYEALWSAELAREQSPTLLPCGGFTNIMCLLGKIADGSLSDYGDPRRWPHYAVKQLPKEDFYKIDRAYDAWHKAHPVPTDGK